MKSGLSQRALPFVERDGRRDRLFKRSILGTTLLAIALMLGASSTARHYLILRSSQARDWVVNRLVGLAPNRAQIDAQWALRRQRGIEQTRQTLERFYANTTDEMRELFRVARMDPEHGLLRYGRGDQAFLISSEVFEPDNKGRSYRFRPETRSVWLRQVTLHNGPFGLFQVLDTPRHRAAAAKAGAIVDEHSLQHTNRWGLRGPEPDLSAPGKGIVLGDSFMQAMFNGDDETPSLYLERYLETAWKVPVTILNTGHIGYSPEQYYFSLVEYGERMRPQFVVVSVCPNDFGDGWAVLGGEGDWFDEAEYWIGQIGQWCRARNVLCVLVPVPIYFQVETSRRDSFYPGQVNAIFHGHPSRYCDPLNDFIDENLRLNRLALAAGGSAQRSQLYNRHIDDDHFSPKGAELWASIVGRRITRILDAPASIPGKTATAASGKSPRVLAP